MFGDFAVGEVFDFPVLETTGLVADGGAGFFNDHSGAAIAVGFSVDEALGHGGVGTAGFLARAGIHTFGFDNGQVGGQR